MSNTRDINIRVELYERAVPARHELKQGDTTRLIVDVRRSGEPYDLAGLGLLLNVKRHDELVYLQTTGYELAGNVATFTLEPPIVAEPGDIELELVLTNADGEVFSSFVFRLTVAARLLTGDEDIAPEVQQQIIDAANAAALSVTQAREARDAAETAAFDAKASEDAAAKSEAAAAQSEKNAADSEASAKQSAETSGAAAKASAESETAARKSANAAETAQKAAESAKNETVVLAEGAAKDADRAETAASVAQSSASTAASTAANAAASAKNAAVSEAAAEQARDETQRLRDEAVSTIDAEKTAAITDITDAQNTAISNVETAGNDAVEKVAQARQTAVSDVDAAGTAAVGAVSAARDAAVSNVNAAGDAKIAEIEQSGVGGAVRFDTAQTLTDGEQAQARENISASGVIVETASGDGAIEVNDSTEAALRGLRIFGKSTQDGTPLFNSPVPIVSVGDKGAINALIVGTDPTLTLATPNGLPGAPTDDGGNYTDANGQQWVCDEVDFERGVYVRRIEEIVLNENTEWVFYKYGTISGVRTLDVLKEKRSLAKGVFTHGVVYISQIGARLGLFLGFSNSIIYWIGILDALGISTLDEFIEWITEQNAAGTPPTVKYALKTPIETPLTEEELAAYRALRTQYPTTTIANDEGAGMELSYVADTKTYIDNKFAELSAAIVNA